MTSKTALLFVNGVPPKKSPSHLKDYAFIACTDGAYHNYLCQTAIKPDFIIGDLDSINHHQVIPTDIQIIHTPDQNKTDFEKALLFLAQKGVTAFDIYGATGHASDHFLGNLSVVMHYYKQYQITFYDDYCYFFFAKPHQEICNQQGKIISLMPLSTVTHLSITGFKYPLVDATLSLGGLSSLRNQVTTDMATVSFQRGDLLIFIAEN